ncbi:MAG: hypothetical protein RLZ97_2569 [Verrucomicrobiota bacterium]|jgi:DNA-binding beta-propeller fold protein YncE/mono/diheme cytochrome c family protein
MKTPVLRRLFRGLAFVALVIVGRLGADTRYQSPVDLAFSPDGRWLAVADATAPGVHMIDSSSHEVVGRARLNGMPDAVVWWNGLIHVSETGAGSIAVVDPVTGEIIRRHHVGRHPRGLAIAAKRKWLLSCDWGRDCVEVIDLDQGSVIATIPVGRQPTRMALSPDESTAVVTNLLPSGNATDPSHAADVTIIDLEQRSARATLRLPPGASNTRGVAIAQSGKAAYVLHTLGRVHLPTTQLDRGWVNTNALSIIDIPSATLTATVLLDQGSDGAADPWGAALTPDGTGLHITLAGTHQLAVIDLHGLSTMLAGGREALAQDLSALYQNHLIRRIDLPAKGPRGLAMAPDGARLAVAGYFSGNVVMMDRQAAVVGTISLGPQSDPDLVRKGEIAFHDAGLCYQRWLSCATCHPGARADGLNWDLLNDGVGNPKNARSMLLGHRTPPVMSLGVRADQATAIRAGFVHIQFTEPEPATLAAVGAYLQSLQPAISPHSGKDGSPGDAARRGREIFHRPAVGCASCHPSPLFTDLKLHDVGTRSPSDPDHGRYDPPSLVELWATPPYLHDGRAATVREVITVHNPDDDHGMTSHLTDAEIDDLVAYLLSL